MLTKLQEIYRVSHILSQSHFFSDCSKFENSCRYQKEQKTYEIEIKDKDTTQNPVNR